MPQIAGNQSSRQLVREVLTRKPLVRTLFLAGPDYIGKRTFVQDLLSELAGDEDVLLAPPGIDGAREARSFLSSRPGFGPFRAVLVDDASRLGEPAQDAFLKLCEDTPASCVLLFLASDMEALLPALRSRADSVVRWGPLSGEEMSEAVGAADPETVRLCCGRPGLHPVVSGPEYRSLYEAVLRALSSDDPFLSPAPEAVKAVKGSRSPERDAVALVCRLAARDAVSEGKTPGPKARLAMQYAAILESVPSANADIYWQTLCVRLAMYAGRPCQSSSS